MSLPSIDRIATALGGDVAGGEVLVPGPGHSATDRSLSIKLDDAAPDGFVVHSFAGDDPIACKDHVRQKLGLEPFDAKQKRNGGGATWKVISQYVYRTETGEPYLLVKKCLDENGKKQYPQWHRE